MGTPKFCIPILDSIFNSKHKILHVYTQSPKKKIVGKKKITHLFMITLLKKK